MLHHVTLIEPLHGKLPWRLVGPEGKFLGAFEVFARSLIRKHSSNTREVYCRSVAYFIDYLLEFIRIMQAKGHCATQSDILDAIDAYDEYLVTGGASGSEIAALVSQSRPSSQVSPKTSAVAHAAIRKFLQLSERLRGELLELSRAQVIQLDVPASPDPFVPSQGRLPIPSVQRTAIASNSMLANVVAGGSKLIDATLLPTTGGEYVYDDSRAFPFDRIVDFLQCLPTYRDKALYALVAGTGCRIHEAIQILFEDIDVENREIKLKRPSQRRNHASYLYLSQAQRDLLCWKGRETSETFFIEPFASIFFEELERYLATEYIAHGRHSFVFQSDSGADVGEPYFLSDASYRRKIFKRTVAAADIPIALAGPHSLRHAYGIYLLNYFPCRNGEHGLSLAVVQQIMGHKYEKYTRVYARYDKDLLKQELEYANALVYRGGMPHTLLEMKLQALHSQVSKLEAQIANDKKGMQ
ncbi:site-specific integrase [Paraburkholderia madseniana]|uniref:tyrosine-type recombinase/integrase n=1 Tax=Paraburkholderia madseniana TaxID=2599607 RepID=UPI001558D0C6|nr:site-specific integrase [Paraburkholderia madseniana]NPT63415.1 tyrosine-type recombinase/integrase [Paraburkholderia madseniana]